MFVHTQLACLRLQRPSACRCSSESEADRQPGYPRHASLAAAATLAAACLQLSVAATPCDAREVAGLVPLKRSVVEDMLVQQFSERVKQMSDAELAEALELALSSHGPFPPCLLPPGPVKGPSLLSRLAPQPKPESTQPVPPPQWQQQQPEEQLQGLNPLQFFQQPFAPPWQQPQLQQQQQAGPQPFEQQQSQLPPTSTPSSSSGSGGSPVEGPPTSRGAPAPSSYPAVAPGPAPELVPQGREAGSSASSDSASTMSGPLAGPPTGPEQTAVGSTARPRASTQQASEGSTEELDLTQQLFERFGQLASGGLQGPGSSSSSSPPPGSNSGSSGGVEAPVDDAISRALASLEESVAGAAAMALTTLLVIAVMVYGIAPVAVKAVAGLWGGGASQGRGQGQGQGEGGAALGALAQEERPLSTPVQQAAATEAAPWWTWILQRLPETGATAVTSQNSPSAAAAAAQQVPPSPPAPRASAVEGAVAGLGLAAGAASPQAVPGGAPPPPPPFPPGMAPGVGTGAVGSRDGAGGSGSGGVGILWQRKSSGEEKPPATAIAPGSAGATAAGWQPQRQQQQQPQEQQGGTAAWAGPAMQGPPRTSAAGAEAGQQAGAPASRADFWAMSEEELRNFQVWDGSDPGSSTSTAPSSSAAVPAAARKPAAQAPAAPATTSTQSAATRVASSAGAAEGTGLAQRGAPLRRRRGGVMDNAEPADFAAPGSSQDVRSGGP